MRPTKYFAFYNREWPHLAQDNQMPHAVYEGGLGGDSEIAGKYGALLARPPSTSVHKASTHPSLPLNRDSTSGTYLPSAERASAG
jgi:hypothetical protein